MLKSGTNASKQQKSLVWPMGHNMRSKTIFFNICPISLLEQKIASKHEKSLV